MIIATRRTRSEQHAPTALREAPLRRPARRTVLAHRRHHLRSIIDARTTFSPPARQHASPHPHSAIHHYTPAWSESLAHVRLAMPVPRLISVELVASGISCAVRPPFATHRRRKRRKRRQRVPRAIASGGPHAVCWLACYYRHQLGAVKRFHGCCRASCSHASPIWTSYGPILLTTLASARAACHGHSCRANIPRSSCTCRRAAAAN